MRVVPTLEPIPAAIRIHPTTIMYLNLWVRLMRMLATMAAGAMKAIVVITSKEE